MGEGLGLDRPADIVHQYVDAAEALARAVHGGGGTREGLEVGGDRQRLSAGSLRLQQDRSSSGFFHPSSSRMARTADAGSVAARSFIPV